MAKDELELVTHLSGGQRGRAYCNQPGTLSRSDYLSEVNCSRCLDFHKRNNREHIANRPKNVPITIESKAGWEFEHLKHQIIFKCLKENNWNRTYTSYDLGISVRTVRTYIIAMRKAGFIVKDSKA